MALLEVKNVCKYYEGIVALENVNLEVFDSEIVGLIGPNGAGKTTLFNVVTGFLSASRGIVIFDNVDITGFRADQIAHMGIGKTFQASVLFMQATVFDNVFFAFHKHYKEPGWKAFMHTPGARKEDHFIKERVTKILQFVGLDPLKDEMAANLSHGHQRLLGVSLALATNPKLLLLDEPVAGMNSVETTLMVDLIRKIREKETAVVVIEHDMKAIMALCDRIVALHYGRKIAEGQPDEIRNNEALIEAYLGREIEYA